MITVDITETDLETAQRGIPAIGDICPLSTFNSPSAEHGECLAFFGLHATAEDLQRAAAAVVANLAKTLDVPAARLTVGMYETRKGGWDWIVLPAIYVAGVAEGEDDENTAVDDGATDRAYDAYRERSYELAEAV